MSNGATGTQVNAVATVFPCGKGSTLCKAYVLGLQDWCKAANKKPRGDFNNYVFNRLKGVKPDGAAIFNVLDPRREMPVGAIFGGGLGAQGFENLANGATQLATAAGKAAQAVQDAIALGGMATGGFPSYLFRKCGAAAMRGEFGGVTLKRVLIPDALQPNGRPIEIKRPNERQSHNNQFKNYKKASPDGKLDKLDCKSCATQPCPKSGDCPAPKA